mmetsp:Transcript_73963/g.158509  ORF Transcript_73963/g.158509 Transcript_73963/m.158509 type:complete len:235 (+) Transcript_73963:472-1176(+)
MHRPDLVGGVLQLCADHVSLGAEPLHLYSPVVVSWAASAHGADRVWSLERLHHTVVLHGRLPANSEGHAKSGSSRIQAPDRPHDLGRRRPHLRGLPEDWRLQGPPTCGVLQRALWRLWRQDGVEACACFAELLCASSLPERTVCRVEAHGQRNCGLADLEVSGRPPICLRHVCEHGLHGPLARTSAVSQLQRLDINAFRCRSNRGASGTSVHSHQPAAPAGARCGSRRKGVAGP